MPKPIVVQYIIPLPFTVEEYEIAKLFCVAEASKGETGGGDGIQIVTDAPYENERVYYGKGQYTNKIFHMSQKVPSILRALGPNESLEVQEQSWNAHPYCKTVCTNPYMKEAFLITIDSVHKPGRHDDEENRNAQPSNEKPIVDIIDIVNDKVDPRDYREDEDPTKFHSTKTGRGPLAKDWMKKQGDYPMMTCFKLYQIEFKWKGLESWMQNRIQMFARRLLHKFHRQMFCWIDRWHGLTIEEIREMEKKTKIELDKLRREGAVRGMTET